MAMWACIAGSAQGRISAAKLGIESMTGFYHSADEWLALALDFALRKSQWICNENDTFCFRCRPMQSVAAVVTFVSGPFCTVRGAQMSA